MLNDLIDLFDHKYSLYCVSSILSKVDAVIDEFDNLKNQEGGKLAAYDSLMDLIMKMRTNEANHQKGK